MIRWFNTFKNSKMDIVIGRVRMTRTVDLVIEDKGWVYCPFPRTSFHQRNDHG